MKSMLGIVATLLVTFAATARAADETDALIAADKQWGESDLKGDTNTAAKLLADKVVSVMGNGVTGKQGLLAVMRPAPAGARYEPTDYKVTFINADTAIMTHGTKGADAHYSLHVWSRIGGTWQVVATSATPASVSAASWALAALSRSEVDPRNAEESAVTKTPTEDGAPVQSVRVRP